MRACRNHGRELAAKAKLVSCDASYAVNKNTDSSDASRRPAHRSAPEPSQRPRVAPARRARFQLALLLLALCGD